MVIVMAMCLFPLLASVQGGDCQCTGIRREFIPDKYVWPQQRAMDVFPIVCLIHRLAWKSVVILFDSTQEPIVQAMLTYWSDTQTQIQVQMICVDRFRSDGSVSNLLGDLYHSVPRLNVILMARFSVVSGIIKEVNDYDIVSNRTTDFRHRSKWIVVADDFVKENLATWATELENVAVVIYSHLTGTKHLKIFTIVLSHHGPTLMPVPIRNWHLTTDDIFPNIKYKYNRRQLVIVRGPDDTFTQPTFRNDTRAYEGFAIDILDILANHLNFTYTIVEPKDKQWGLLENGSWNGIVGMLAKKEVDLQISSLTIHEDRARVMYFLQPPVYTQVIDVMYKRSDMYEDNWFTYIRQFRPVVFLCIGLSAAVFCLLFVLTESCRPAQQTTRSTKSSSCPNEFETIPDASGETGATCGKWRKVWLLLDRIGWFIVASVAQRSASISTRVSSSSILVASWQLFLIVTTAAYTANLVADLMSRKPRVPFRTLGELVDNKDFTFGMTSTGINTMIFEKSKNEDMKRAWASIQDRISTDPNILHGTDEYHLRRLSTGRYAWISSRKTANFIRNKDDCSLVFMNSPFNWQLLAFGVPIGSPYISDFENTLSLLNDNGIILHLRNKWFKTPCDNEKQLWFESARIIQLSDVRGIFILLPVGIGLATTVVILELVYTRARIKLQTCVS